MNPLLQYDEDLRKTYPTIVGVDEVGRGTLAGPLVVAAVILPPSVDIPGVIDSKQVPKSEHRRLVDEILKVAVEVKIGVATPEKIDEVNILNADKYAMSIAIKSLTNTPDLVLIDGNDSQLMDDIDILQKTQVKGDSHSLTIAAASLVAKSVRDEMMANYAKDYPEYGFENNSGYGTPKHRQAIERYGVTPIHRRTFAPIKNGNYKEYEGKS